MKNVEKDDLLAQLIWQTRIGPY